MRKIEITDEQMEELKIVRECHLNAKTAFLESSELLRLTEKQMWERITDVLNLPREGDMRIGWEDKTLRIYNEGENNEQ